MTKQKKGFWLFIFSLLPGAGELYMGFRKMGLSIMTLFFGIIACASMLGLDALVYFIPIIWFYSFFNVHNLKILSEEEFLAVEDDYIFHTDSFVKNNNDYIKKYRSILALLLITFGISGLLHSFAYCLQSFIPHWLYECIQDLRYRIPSLVISILLIVIGVKLIKGKREELENDEVA